jgi:hypothetical protein
VIAAPVNYRLHIEEMRPLLKGELHAVERYGLFLKAPSSVVGPGATIELPFPDRRTDHEVELGVVIGRTARNVAAAMPFIFFGQLLAGSGGSSFFNDLALALMGRYRAAPPRYRRSPRGSSGRSRASSSRTSWPRAS